MNPLGAASTWQALLVHPDPASRRYVRMVMNEFSVAVTERDNATAVTEQLAGTATTPIGHSWSLVVVDASALGCADLLSTLKSRGTVATGQQVLLLVSGPEPKQLATLLPPDALQVVAQPVTATDLRAAVSKAIARLQSASQPDSASRAAEPSTTRLKFDTAAAIATYFEGDKVLYETYRSACFAQFPADIDMGQNAVAKSDLQTLRRCAHSLKSVLLTLGYQGVSKQAATVETLSHEGQTQAALAGWSALNESMQQLIDAQR